MNLTTDNIESIRSILNDFGFPEPIKFKLIQSIYKHKTELGYGYKNVKYFLNMNYSDNSFVVTKEEKKGDERYTLGYEVLSDTPTLCSFSIVKPTGIEKGQSSPVWLLSNQNSDYIEKMKEVLKSFITGNNNNYREKLISNAINYNKSYEYLIKKDEDDFWLCEKGSIEDGYSFEIKEKHNLALGLYIAEDFKACIIEPTRNIPPEFFRIFIDKVKLAEKIGVDISGIRKELNEYETLLTHGTQGEGETPAAPGEDGSEHDI